MNILPKKRWHVKNKDNAAKVEADELQFHRKQKADDIRSLVATQEARVDYLRKQRKPSSSINNLNSDQTLQLFADVEENRYPAAVNKEYEAEKKDEKEKWEKQVGILKYLGETSDGKAVEKPWWSIVPKREKRALQSADISEETDLKKKRLSDPLCAMKRIEADFSRIREKKVLIERKERAAAAKCVGAYPSFFPDDIKNPGSTRPSILKEVKSLTPATSTVTSPIDRLRAERLSRERAERERAAVLLCKSMGLGVPSQPDEEEQVVNERRLPFNSAFNPELSSLAAERRLQHREYRKRRSMH